MNKDNATNLGKIRTNSFEFPTQQYAPSVRQQALLSKRILCEVPTELQNVERSVIMKEVNTQNLWTFELGTQEGINVPRWIILGVEIRERQDSQHLNNDTFCRPPVTSAECNIGTRRYPDSAILLIYVDDFSSQGDGQIKEAFRAFTRDDMF